MSRGPKPIATQSHVDDSAWRKLVNAALAGREFDALVHRSDDDIKIGPIYGAANATDSALQEEPPEPWVIVQRVDDPDIRRSTQTLATDIAGGAGGIELVMADGMSAARTGFGLNDVDDQLVATLSRKDGLHLRIDGGETVYALYRQLADVDFAELTLSYDPLAHAAARGGFDDPLADIESDIVNATLDFAENPRPGASVVADGRIWAAGGASEVQEIAGVLGTTIHVAKFLIAAGFAPKQALESIGIVVDAGANQLLTIAKLRALRLCHARVVEVFGSDPTPARIHAETSWRMMTRYDVHTNILRTTSAAFAAGIAGADSITVLPFTCAMGLADDFARRVARNSQTILLEESGLARVVDPGAGSGAIESLTDAIAEAAWSRFTELEAAGGFLAAIRSGSFQHEIGAMGHARAEQIAHLAQPVTGVSAFPDIELPESRVLASRPTATEKQVASVERMAQLVAVRLAEPFESLRDRACELADRGRSPRVYLATLGTPADFADAAQAAVNFFAAGGVRVHDGNHPTALSDVTGAFAQSGAAVACIAGAQHDLDRGAVETAAALKTAGAVRIYVIGGTASSEAIDAVINKSVDATVVLADVLASTS